MPEPANPFQFLEVKLSAGTPIEEILKAVGLMIKPVTDAISVKRETMSQEMRDRNDRLEVAFWENIFTRLGLVRPEQLQVPPQVK